MSDAGSPRVTLAARLAARAVALALDAASAPADVAEHLLHLAREDAAVLNRAASRIERRHHDPESAVAKLAILSLRMASSLAADAATRPDGVRGVRA